MLLSGAVRPLPWERVQLLSVLFVYSYIIFAFQKRRQCRSLEFVTPQDLRNDFITLWLATAFECTGTHFYFVSELEVSVWWQIWEVPRVPRMKGLDANIQFSTAEPVHRKNTMSSFIFFIMWFLKVAKTFTGLPPSPVRFQVAWLPGTHSLCCFRTPRCLFVLHKPTGQKSPLVRYIYFLGKKKKKRKPSFRSLLTLGKWASCPGRNEMNDKCRGCLCWVMEPWLALRRAPPRRPRLPEDPCCSFK